jgi:hypothetical protein
MPKKTAQKYVTDRFRKLMMEAPPFALNLQFYKDTLASAVSETKAKYPDNVDEIDTHEQKLKEDFTWFDPEPEEGVGGHFRNMDNPQKLTMQEMHELLGITDKPEEKEKANTLYGYTE